jgi:hypothetical protein
MKRPATLVRTHKRPVLATLYVGEDTFHVVEVVSRGGPKYALGSKVKSGFNWVIGPTGKAELWEKMKETWDITVK